MKQFSPSISFSKAMSLAVITLAIALLFLSCKKNEAATSSTSITDDEVAQAVTESVSDSSGGLVTQTQSSAEMASTSTLTCGESSDTTITGQNISGTSTTYNYSLQFSRELTCTNGVIPSQFQFNFSGQANYASPLMLSSDKRTAQFTITGLELSSPSYIFNETYTSNGTQQSKANLQQPFTSTITITSSNIMVDKTTQKIISGTATIQFTGAISGGAGTSRGATLTFLGNGNAMLALNNGNSYPIQW